MYGYRTGAGPRAIATCVAYAGIPLFTVDSPITLEIPPPIFSVSKYQQIPR